MGDSAGAIGVKSRFLRGRIANEDTSGGGMDAACRGGGAITGVFSRVEPTGRRVRTAVEVYSLCGGHVSNISLCP